MKQIRIKLKAGMNVYADMGFPDAEEMLVKARLMVIIAEILRKRGWSQQEAAQVRGLTQPKLSKMLRGQFRGISEMKLMDCLVPLDREVKIVVGPEKRQGSDGLKLWARNSRSENPLLNHSILTVNKFTSFIH